MELTHDFVVPASLEQAWATFMDLERVGSCFPGAQVTEVSDDGFAGTVKVKLGPIALQYAGAGRFLERDDAAHRAVLEAKGKDKRGNGTAGATVTIQLAPADGGTRVDVTTDLAITGKPAQFGRGVMQDVSDKLLQQFVGCIESQFDTEPAPEAESVAEAGDSEASATADLAREVADDEGMALSPAEIAEGTGEGAGDAHAAAAVASQVPTLKSAGASPAPTTRAQVKAAAKPADDDALDLGATVLPVLLKAYAPQVAVALAALALGILIGRRRR